MTAEKDLPRPRPAPAGAINVVDYPHRNDQQPGAVWLAWPAERRLDSTEKALLELFLHNVAGDPTTNLYKRLIDSKTRETELGAKSVFASVSEDVGNPVLIGFGDVPAARMNERELGDLRARVKDELRRIAAWPAGSTELAAFNARLASRIVQTRRQLSKFVNTPPTFGFRGGSSDWLTQLHELNQMKSFRKSLTFKPQIAAVEKVLAADGNVWTGYLARWRLLDAEPWVLAARPRPDLIQQAQAERDARVEAELRRLQQHYCMGEAQEAIRRYRADYDVRTAAIDQAAAAAAEVRRPATADPRRPARLQGHYAGRRRAAGGFHVREHDQRDGRHRVVAGRRARESARVPGRAAGAADPRRRDRQRAAGVLRGDE
ncbi:MAG: hypothetical protein IPI73_30810 [Betaproteobacteria bacterium]|nr:hypothetical protein [Betaproteobacteria bacterium]